MQTTKLFRSICRRCTPLQTVSRFKPRQVFKNQVRTVINIESDERMAEDFHTFLDRKEVEDRVYGVCKLQPKVKDDTKFEPATHFEKDLALDSLDRVEIVMAFEEEFAIEIPDEEAEQIQTIKDVIDLVVNHPRAD
eukprot:257366_1